MYTNNRHDHKNCLYGSELFSLRKYEKKKNQPLMNKLQVLEMVILTVTMIISDFMY